MDRAYKFMEDIADHALKLMEKEAHKMSPREIDYIAAICNLHNEVCEFIEIVEKEDGYVVKPHKYMNNGNDNGHDNMWEGNPRRMRRR